MLYQAGREALPLLTKLALELWPAHTAAELTKELSPLLESEEAAFFIAANGSGPVGFAQCQLRRDYVEGAQSSPVGYSGARAGQGHCGGTVKDRRPPKAAGNSPATASWTTSPARPSICTRDSRKRAALSASSKPADRKAHMHRHNPRFCGKRRKGPGSGHA